MYRQIGSLSRPMRHPLVLLLVALLLAATGVSLGSGSASAATGGDTAQTHVKQASLQDHYGDCGANNLSGQLNVTEPEGVTLESVTLSDGTVLGPNDVTYSLQGNVLQITVPLSSGVYITDAVITHPSGWAGQFVLSHYSCGSTTPPPPVPPNPPTPMCPNGTPWVDSNMNGLMDECGTTPPPPTPPFNCPDGQFYAGDLNHNGVMDVADCQAPPTTPKKLVYGKARKIDKCGTAGDRYGVRASKGVIYKADGKRIKREGVWLKTHGDSKIVIKAFAASKRYQLVGPNRWVFKYGTKPCKVPDTQAPSGAKRVA